MKLRKALKLFRELCNEFGVLPIPVLLSDKKISLIGLTYYASEVPVRFVFSKRFILFCDEKTVEKTFRHEIAHYFDILERGCTDHGDNWKKWCAAVGHDGSSNKLPIEYYRSVAFCPNKGCPSMHVWVRTIPKRIPDCTCCNVKMELYINKGWK